jgi:hypothetical protein
VPEDTHVEVWLVAIGLTVGALTCALWEPFAQLVTSYGEGEPIAMLEGISVWPTVLLRLLSIILGWYFIFRWVLPGLDDNLAKITGEVNLKTPRASSQNNQVRAAWETYVDQERFWHRLIRAGRYTGIMFVVYLFVLAPIFGQPDNPARGKLAYNAYKCTTIGDVATMLLLTFIVFDATFQCLRFVNKLCSLRGAKTEWPSETIEIYNAQLRIETKVVNYWTDLDFVAKRTRCIGVFIYFPFVLIALLIVSRSTVFANYAPNLAGLIAEGISLSFVFGGSIMLWWAAKAAQDSAKQNLTDEIIRENGPCAENADSNNGARQEGLNSNSRYAKQLEILMNRVDQLNDGAFRPLMQQPLVKALLLPLSSAGWVALIENGMLPGL